MVNTFRAVRKQKYGGGALFLYCCSSLLVELIFIVELVAVHLF